MSGDLPPFAAHIHAMLSTRRCDADDPLLNDYNPTLVLRLRWAETELTQLVTRRNLDSWLDRNRSTVARLDAVVDEAMCAAYGAGDHEAHRFLQRILYRINRLMLFWFDDLRLYENERSPFLLKLRATIESRWQAWERLLVPTPLAVDVHRALRDRAAADLDAPPSTSGVYFRDHATLAGYRRLIAITSLDGLVEASQLSRTLGGVSNPIHEMLTRLLLEEYGGGRLERKHSTYFHTMLDAVDMDSKPEAYFDTVPWEVLANINHSFLLSDRRRLFLRYIGGLLYTEISTPAAFSCYVAAANRLGVPAGAKTYWELHIKEDAHHGPWMLDDVALPLAGRYPDDAAELLFGYDQQRTMSARAGEATARSAMAAD
jgi:hypothetical protein